jgi:hypothetical protein
MCPQGALVRGEARARAQEGAGGGLGPRVAPLMLHRWTIEELRWDSVHGQCLHFPSGNVIVQVH